MMNDLQKMGGVAALIEAAVDGDGVSPARRPDDEREELG